ncbi:MULTISPECIES: very short patch repair endonuclease [Thalassospira]|uniref:Very short patch repair endonuclease n=2 Tax=Thalassospira TaxID=168934 RepID=A0A367W3X5_9PROT|nr:MULTISPECIES: DNA mismatch endonuclease Vsr [Thalassospira]MDG4720188.1 DNA mismatch endonuclease Vsr [Thalassospira sp. FZY0004]RCK33042.1 DNA glycosylase [Thalassospira profundimaris]
MADIVSPEQRSKMMSKIRATDTRPEILVRKALYARGFRYRLHDRQLPGKPDLVLPKYNAVIFVHGCFWHGHDCHLFRWPKSREEFWREKLSRNRLRDSQALVQLHDKQIRTLIVWECSLKGKGRLDFSSLVNMVSDWLKGNSNHNEIRGRSR